MRTQSRADSRPLYRPENLAPVAVEDLIRAVMNASDVGMSVCVAVEVDDSVLDAGCENLNILPADVVQINGNDNLHGYPLLD